MDRLDHPSIGITIFQSFWSIGLTTSPNSPCLFTGTLIPGESPLYLGLYVDDIAFFSHSDAVEQKFRDLLNAVYTVSYEDSHEWFLGMKFAGRKLQTPSSAMFIKKLSS